MNTSRKFLRLWLTITSFVGFIVGWFFLSHTTDVKTVTVGNTTVTIPALQAIPTVQSVTSNSALNNVQNFTLNPNTSQAPSFFSPQLRTGGS